MTIETMKQALEALEHLHRTGDTQVFDLCYAPKVIPALRAAIAEAEKQDPVAHKQVPVAWLDEYGHVFPLAAKQYSVVGKHWEPLYTTPPAAQRQWIGLTDEEKRQIVLDDPIDWVAAIEAKLKEKNT